jgi:hypothetical protein
VQQELSSPGTGRADSEPDQHLPGGLGEGEVAGPGEGGIGLLGRGGGRASGAWGSGGTARSAANPTTPTTSAASARGASRRRQASSDSGSIAAATSSFKVRTCP